MLQPDELVKQLVLLCGQPNLQQRLLKQGFRVAKLQRKLHLNNKLGLKDSPTISEHLLS
jgi:hypothetical protein